MKIQLCHQINDILIFIKIENTKLFLHFKLLYLNSFYCILDHTNAASQETSYTIITLLNIIDYIPNDPVNQSCI